MADSPPKRPRTISLVLLLLIILGIIQAATVVALIRQSALLLDLQVRPDPRLRLLIAAVWMVLFWSLAIALWRKKALTRWLIPLCIAFYALYELAILAVFVQVPISSDRWLQYSFFAVTLVLFAYWALNRSAAKPYFLEDGSAAG